MSFILIKRGEIYSPEYNGNKDILIVNDKILLIDRNYWRYKVIGVKIALSDHRSSHPTIGEN